jgi:hypothetical protein
MADQMEEADNPIGVGISEVDVTQETQPAHPGGQGEADDLVTEDDATEPGQHGELDVPQETQPAHPGGQGEADDLVIEEDTTEPGQHDEPPLTDRGNAPEGVAEEDHNEHAPHNEPLEVLSDHVYSPEGTDDLPPGSAFSSSSSDDDDDPDDDEPEQGGDEFGNAANLEPQSTSYGLWQPYQEPYRPVLGIKGADDDIYRPNCYGPWNMSKLHPDRESGFSNSNQRMKTNEEFRAAREDEPHRLVRPSPLRTASSPDSPVSPKKTDPTGGVGTLPEPSPGLRYDQGPVSPLSDRELRPRPQNPSPPESPHDGDHVSPLPLTDRELNLRLRNSTPPEPSRYTSDIIWEDEAEDDPNESIEDKKWYTEYIAKSPGSPPADGGDEALSDEQRSPVSPIDPVTEPETRCVLYRSNPPNETFDDTEASEADVQMPQQTGTAPATFESVYVEAEEHYDPEKEISPTSPHFFGPEPLTGKTPQEGIEAWWAFRETFRAASRTFRTNRNPANQDEMGDLQPTTATNDAATVEAKMYLAARRLDVQQLVNIQQTNLQAMARQSDELSKVIESDLKQTLEYVKLRMLKYRSERNKYYEERDQAYREASRQLDRVGRRDQEINDKNKEFRQAEQEANQYITHLNTKLWETERAYNQVLAEKKDWEPTLRKEREKRERLKAEYKAQAEMSAAYLKAAESSSGELRTLRAKFARKIAPLQFSLIMEVASQEPVPAANEGSKQRKQATPLQVSSIMDAASQAPVSGSSEKPKQPKQAAPLQFSSIMEVYPQEPVIDTREKPHPDTNDVPQSDTNDKPKSDKSEKRKSGVSQPAKHGRRITSQQFSSFMEVVSRNSVSGTNTKPERTKRAKRAAPGHLSPFMTYEDFDSQGYESDAGPHPKSAPPTYRPRRGPPPPLSPISPSHLSPPHLAPEHEANWPLAVRPRVVDFMTEWINNNRETRQPNDAPKPLQKAQLDKILGVGFLSWDRLIKELSNLGYNIRRDHLAQALSNSNTINAYNLPKPNTAVLYEARRLTKHNAVKELVDEVEKLKRELENVKMPWEWVEKFEPMEPQNKLLVKENEELNAKLDEVYQGLDGIAELEKAWKEIDRLRDVLTDCATNPDYEHSPADQEEIRTLKEGLATTQETLAEVLQTSPPPKQKMLTEVKSDSMHTASLLPSGTPGFTELLDKLTGMNDAKRNACKDRNVKLTLENGTLTQKLDAMRSDADDRAQELISSHASYASLVKTSSKKIASLEAKLSADDSSQTGDAKSSSSVEDKLAKCHEHGMRLESDITDLRRKLGDSRAKVADLETKLAAHDSDQDGDDTGDRVQIEALKKRVFELEQELATFNSNLEGRENELKEQLAACRSRGRKLQERIDELEVQLETQGLQQQGSAGTGSELSDRLEASKQHAKDLQEKVDELQLKLEEAKKNTKKSRRDKVLASIAETKAHRDSLEVQTIAKSEEVIAALQKALEAAEKENLALKSREKPLPADGDADKTADKYEAERLAEWNGRLLEDAKVASDIINALIKEAEVADKEILTLQEQAESHEKPLPTDEPAPVSPGPAIAAPDQPEDIATLRRELAEAREKNEKLGLDNLLLQTSLGQAQEGLSTLRQQVKSESQGEPEPAGERRSDIYSQGFEDDDAPLPAERTRNVSADGSTTEPEKFVLEQSDSEAEKTSDKHSETGNAGSSSGSSSDVEFVPDVWTQGPPSRPDGHIRDSMSRFRRPDEGNDRDDDESDAEDVDSDADKSSEEHESKDLAEANASLRRDAEVSRAKINKLEKELKVAKSNRPIAAVKAKKPLPAASKPAQSQQLPKAVETEPEPETRTMTRILAPRPPQAARKGVPLPVERLRITRPMTMAQTARRMAMYQLPTYIADAERRRGIREAHFAERRERIRLICERAASIFGEKDLPYVPVEQRYKTMARREIV